MPRLIDADALLEKVKESIKQYAKHRDILRLCADVKGLIMSAPTIDAEPVRHGRWLLEAHKEKANYRWNVTAECSECCDEQNEIYAGFFPGVPDYLAKDVILDSAKSVKLSNYCPNCGAKMDLE